MLLKNVVCVFSFASLLTTFCYKKKEWRAKNFVFTSSPGVPFSFIRPIDKVYIHRRIKSPDISYQNNIFKGSSQPTTIRHVTIYFETAKPKEAVSIYIIRPLLTIFASFICDESAVEPSVMIIHYLAIKTLNAERLNHILTRAFLELGQRLGIINRLVMSAKYYERHVI